MNKTLCALALAFLLSACVNLHVHFPEAPAEKGAQAGQPAPAQSEK